MTTRRTLVHPLLATVFCGVVFLGLGGCVSSDVDAEDTGTVFAAARFDFDLSAPLSGPRPENGRRGGFRQYFELDVTGGLGDTDVSGGIGDADYRLVHAGVAYKPGFRARRVEAFGLFGFGVDRIQFDDNPLFDVSDNYYGPFFGFEARVRLREWIGPYMRAKAHLLDDGYAGHFEAGLKFTPTEELDLFVAYHNWEGEYDDITPTNGDVDIDMSGVLFGMTIRL